MQRFFARFFCPNPNRLFLNGPRILSQKLIGSIVDLDNMLSIERGIQRIKAVSHCGKTTSIATVVRQHEKMVSGLDL